MSSFTEKIKKFPTSPGIYLFYNKKRELIYVGKATSLRERVRSYFTQGNVIPRSASDEESRARSFLPRVRGRQDDITAVRPIEAMIHEVADIRIIKTDSVLEAVILEGKYIKKFLPKYNVDWKDDKSWNYLVVTNEKFPRLVAVRQREMDKVFLNSKNKITSPNPPPDFAMTKSLRAGLLIKEGSLKLSPLLRGRLEGVSNETISTMKQWKFVFGPFPSLNTRETLKILHKLFYVSRCEPNAKKSCFDYQIGHCLGVCTNEISARDYEKKVIKPLVAFLSGEKKRLVISLNNAMKTAAKNENFEEAARLRNQINALKHIQDVTLLNKEFYKDNRNQKLEIGNQKTKIGNWKLEIGNSLQSIRIEAYDISNLGDSGKVGSMIVFDESGPIKSEYRKFKIRTVAGQSDVDCLKEILTRRLNHSEWQLPNLILVDGGAPQVNAMQNTLQENKIDLPIIGIAKGAARKNNEFIFGKNSGSWQNWVLQNGSLLIQARDEAHRFAIAYQKKMRRII
jgi:excinuclease ABC subunit C